MTISQELRDAYRYHRTGVLAPTTAKDALPFARHDVAKGTRRYPEPGGFVVSWQPERPTYAWVEDTTAIGLRFVGHADEIVRLRHTGWLTDDDFQDETLRGGVWQLPARHGKPMYVAGYSDPINKGAAFLELGSPIEDDKIQAAYAADHIAELTAESEREYHAASNARLQFEELETEIATTRREILDVLAERRTAKVPPAMCRVLTEHVRHDLDAIRKARLTRAKLLDRYGREEGWQDF